MQPDLYKVVVNNQKANAIKVQVLGDNWTKGTNMLNLCNVLSVLCSSCGDLNDSYQQRVLENTRKKTK